MPKKLTETTIDGTRFRVKTVGGITGEEVIFRVGYGLAMEDLKVEDFNWLRKILRDSAEIEIIDKEGDGRANWIPLSTVYDEHFSGNYAAAGAFLKFAWEANFGPFGGVLAGLASVRKELSRSISPTTPAGSAGASSPTKG
jgi:hypothetical protein